MEHIKHLSLGWLVGAAALLFAGCSSEDGVIAEETKTIEPQATVIHVTVGAGITDPTPDPSPTREGSSADDGAAAPLPSRGGAGVGSVTRSTVVKDGSTRTLQFTSGDRLYVWGQKNKIYDQLDNYYYEYVVAGTLELVAIDSEDPTKATFSGDLSVYRAEVQGDDVGVLTLYGVTYPDGNLVSDLSAFLQSDDPLGEFENVKATLIHEDAAEYVDYFISEDDRMVYYLPDCAATVEELMTTQLWVSGLYDSGTKSFALAKDTDQPIVNCTISGLEAGVSYMVKYIYGTTAAMSDYTKTLFSSLTATAGTLSFAFIAQTGDKFHGIRLTNTGDAGDTYTVTIGQKEFESKVYNVTRYWTGSEFIKAEPKEIPLTIEAITAGTIVVNNPRSGMQYSLNGGDKTPMTETTTIEVAKGDKVQFYGNGTSISSYYLSSNDYTEISGGTAEVKVYGNIMSLVNETGFATATLLTDNSAFLSFFKDYSNLTDASGLLLPAKTLTVSCYDQMFQGCTSLTAAPALPATKLAESCYKSMFQGCTSLTAAPVLPAKTLADYCYMEMFYDCTSLTAAPVLPAETLANYCYRQMFQNCTSLNAAPVLPAKTLVDYCYVEMFQGCTSLTAAPVLPAETLVNFCYRKMFQGCSSLSAVTCLATNKSAPNCTYNWLSGVAATGTFTRAKGVNWSTGADGIPSGWTKVNAQ